jgi:hypothetical protein
VRTTHHQSFKALASHLRADVGKTFTHKWQDPTYRQSLPTAWRHSLPGGWDLPGPSGSSEAPKYLYRGEAGVYPASLSSRARLAKDSSFSAGDLDLLDRLTEMAADVQNEFERDRLRSLGWPQHYGLPTHYLDLTSDPLVALHFAAGSSATTESPVRVIYRIDLEAVESKVYGPGGRPTPLLVTSVNDEGIIRAARQSAWVICARRDAERFNLKRNRHLSPHVEKFLVEGSDAADFRQPQLLTAEDDRCAAWPLAVVRALKIVAGGGLPRAVAEWLCARIPLYEWTPVEVYYDGVGRSSGLVFLSPSEAKQRDNHDYQADPQEIVEELVSPEIPVPNGILFGKPTGGVPNSQRWIEPGDECEVQWHSSLRSRNATGSGPGWVTFPHAFARVRLR